MQSVTDQDGDSRQVMDGLRRLVRELRTASIAAERMTDLSGAQLFVLRILVREPGLGITRLAARTLTDQSSVSVVVAKLVARKLVKRGQAPDDARRLVLLPTAAGIRLAATGPDPAQERLFAGLARLTPAVRRRLARDLAQWTAAIGIDDQTPDMFFEPARRG